MQKNVHTFVQPVLVVIFLSENSNTASGFQHKGKPPADPSSKGPRLALYQRGPQFPFVDPLPSKEELLHLYLYSDHAGPAQPHEKLRQE